MCAETRDVRRKFETKCGILILIDILVLILVVVLLIAR